MRTLFVIIALVLMPSLAKAACPAAPVGSAQDRVIQMVAGGDNQTQMGSDAVVNATEEGAIVYDATNKAIAVCDGTNWVHSGGGGGGGSSDGCPGASYGGKCYVYVRSGFNHANAQLECEKLGGDLAQVKSAEIQDVLFKLKVDSDGVWASGNSVWIGGEDIVEGTWLWEDGSPFSYTNWASGEPNNVSGNQDCAKLTNNAEWDDAGCYHTYDFICEY